MVMVVRLIWISLPAFEFVCLLGANAPICAVAVHCVCYNTPLNPHLTSSRISFPIVIIVIVIIWQTEQWTADFTSRQNKAEQDNCAAQDNCCRRQFLTVVSSCGREEKSRASKTWAATEKHQNLLKTIFGRLVSWKDGLHSMSQYTHFMQLCS